MYTQLIFYLQGWISLTLYAEAVGFEPTDRVTGLWFSRPARSTTLPYLQNIKFPTSVLEQLTKKVTANVCSLKFIYGADSHCFSLSQSPFHCFMDLWPQSHVCHYKVFQLSIQYSRRVLRIIHHLIQTQPQKLIFEINLINPLRLLSSWHFTHLLCFNSVLRVYDLRPVPLCTLESLTSTGNL